VRVGGVHRLRLLEGLLPLCEAVRVYAAPDGQAAAFLLELGGGHRFLLALSADVWRGFSARATNGDAHGGVADGMDNRREPTLPWQRGLQSILVRAWQHDLAPDTVDRLCASLSAMGLLGFDLADNQHFYRRLPFKLSRIVSMNPRLKNARRFAGCGR
jgi:hypothetical protein